MLNWKRTKLTIVLAILLSFTLAAEEAGDWIGGFSSTDYEEGQEDLPEENIYYFWELENLPKAISPQFIRYLDTGTSLRTGRLINRGILFTYEGLTNDEVAVCADFTYWQCVDLRKNDKGVFYGVLDLPAQGLYEPKEAYEYKFKVDGLFTHDPKNRNTYEDGEGSLISKIQFHEGKPSKQLSTRVLEDSPYEEKEFRTVEFRMVDANAESISLVGDFNHWDPELDFLVKEKRGVFRLVKKLKPGTYYYNFVVDGKVIPEPFNQDTVLREETGEISSTLLVPERSHVLERK
ncbi:carbohydrate-binding module 48 [Leptospira perolatii]|uniref:Carbohydrate-binding module 48 n=1 Tax=Leptospira perolatii TaxID=2023191 RepID=A0A2M9ZMJ7_9LEPT|nr:carbohydrate-binding module 48 [Leptospira perolatii]PJZ70113.1 carbohydrate-binding module 48 [Leptospira perolatii]PJZ73302.1 carbohydrate-binding module 48 [Leptospira perolatii]